MPNSPLLAHDPERTQRLTAELYASPYIPDVRSGGAAAKMVREGMGAAAE